MDGFISLPLKIHFSETEEDTGRMTEATFEEKKNDKEKISAAEAATLVNEKSVDNLKKVSSMIDLNSNSGNSKISGDSIFKSKSAAVTKSVDDFFVQPVYSSQTTNLMNEVLFSREIEKIRGFRSIETVRDSFNSKFSVVFSNKNHFFPTNFYFLAGDRRIAEEMLSNEIGNILRISSLLFLKQSKIEELEK